MKKIITTVLVAMVTLNAFAQEKLRTSQFSKIIIPSNVNAKLVYSDSNAIEFGKGTSESFSKANQEKLFYIKDNTLCFDMGAFNGKFPVEPIIYANQLEEIKLEGNAKIEMGSDSIFKTKSIKIIGNGAIKAELNIEAEKITVEVNGASKLNLTGKASNGFIEATGATKVNAFGMAFENLEASSSGASKIMVTVKNQLKGVASGASKIEFAGNPKNVDKDISGASKITESNGDLASEIEISLKNNENKKKNNSVNSMQSAFSGIELGVSSFVTPQLNTKLDTSLKNLETNWGSSWRFAFNFGDWDLQIVKGRLALSMGLGLSFDHYGFKNKDSVMGDNTKKLEFVESEAPMTTYRLSQFSFTVPLLVKYNGKKGKGDSRFYFAAGVMATYSATNSFYTEYSKNGVEYEKRYRGDYFVNRLRADGTVRAGFGSFGTFVNVGLTPFFETDKMADTRTLQVGVAATF